MSKILSIFSIIGKVLLGIAVISTVGINAFTAYVMFAPDNLPKPFHLVYRDEVVFYQPDPADNSVVKNTIEGDSGQETSTEEASTGQVNLEDVQPGQGLMFNTGTKIVNLADPTGRKYLKTTIVLEFAYIEPEVDPEAEGDEGEGGEGGEETSTTPSIMDELNARLPVINDSLTAVLSSKSFESVYTVEGKEELRQEIIDAVNERLPEYHVIYVYFTEFVVQ